MKSVGTSAGRVGYGNDNGTVITDDSTLITIGRILKPHGVRGDVRVHSLTDVPLRLEETHDVLLVAPTGKSLWTTVNAVRKAGQYYVLGLSAFSSPEEVGDFRGAWMQVPRGASPPLPSFEYYQCDLIGLEVQDPAGRRLGVLEQVLELPHHHVFVVQDGKKEMLIPAVRQIVTQIDLSHRIMTVAQFEN